MQNWFSIQFVAHFIHAKSLELTTGLTKNSSKVTSGEFCEAILQWVLEVNSSSRQLNWNVIH